MLQSVVTYGIALGYIHYKKTVLAPRIAALGGLSAAPELAVASFAKNPTRHPVFFASAALGLVHLIATGGQLFYAAMKVERPLGMVWAFVGGWALLLVTVVIELLLAAAMKRVGAR